MKEYWVNVYYYYGYVSYGMRVITRHGSIAMATQAQANGGKLLYRIHVRLK